MSETRPAGRIQLVLTLAELQAVDDWRLERRMPNRASAIRELLKKGLAAEGFGSAANESFSDPGGLAPPLTTGGWRDSCGIRRGYGVEELADGVPESVAGAGGSASEHRLQLGEHLLDRVQVRRVGRQVEDAGAGGGDRLADACHLVGGKVVHRHDVAGRQAGRKELLDVGANASPVIGPSSMSGAMIRWSSADRPTTVVVRQCPCGSRHRPCARPWVPIRNGGSCWCSRRSRRGRRRRRGP